MKAKAMLHTSHYKNQKIAIRKGTQSNTYRNFAKNSPQANLVIERFAYTKI